MNKLKPEMDASDRYRLHRAVCFKYKMLRIRSKISFIAFLKKKTVFELILKAVYSSFREIAKMKYEEFGDRSDA